MKNYLEIAREKKQQSTDEKIKSIGENITNIYNLLSESLKQFDGVNNLSLQINKIFVYPQFIIQRNKKSFILISISRCSYEEKDQVGESDSVPGISINIEYLNETHPLAVKNQEFYTRDSEINCVMNNFTDYIAKFI